MAYFSVSISSSDIASTCEDEGATFADLINETAPYSGKMNSAWCEEFLQNIDDIGKQFIKGLAAMIDAAASAEGGA